MHVVNRTAEALNARRKAVNGSRVLIVGLAYKPNVDDERESPSYMLMNLLKERGAELAYYDPYVPVIRPTREHPHWAGTRSVNWDRQTLEGFDAVIIATNHQSGQLPGTGRLVAMHRGHAQRHGGNKNQTRPSLEGLSRTRKTPCQHWIKPEFRSCRLQVAVTPRHRRVTATPPSHSSGHWTSHCANGRRGPRQHLSATGRRSYPLAIVGIRVKVVHSRP